MIFSNVFRRMVKKEKLLKIKSHDKAINNSLLK